jgi:translation elongation factor EF-4
MRALRKDVTAKCYGGASRASRASLLSLAPRERRSRDIGRYPPILIRGSG